MWRGMITSICRSKSADLAQRNEIWRSESRIYDVNVAYEMTNFVRNQILTQSAVAMLSQANSLPQMALRLIS